MNQWRDLMCGEPRAEQVGERLTLAGWAARRRDHGGLIFIDLRDHTGHRPARRQPRALAGGGRDRASGAERVRPPRRRRARAPRAGRREPGAPTGEIELQVDMLEIVSRSEPLPFQIDEDAVDELTRLRYRYLDLRGDRMQRNLRLSGAVISGIRRQMESQGFLDVWTPLLTRRLPRAHATSSSPSGCSRGSSSRCPSRHSCSSRS